MSAPSSIPVHMGIILDGNRRWAERHKLPVIEGHRRGLETAKTIALEAFDMGVKYLSAYVFSMENWTRTQEEIGYLMGLVIKGTEKYLDEFDQAGIKIVMLGRRDGLSKNVLKSIEKTEEQTKTNKRGTLAICINYGGREEIADAAKALIKDGGGPEAITPEALAGALYVPDIPDIDLLIRTSGEHRLSGFMLWRAAYTELLFVDKLWPDFNLADLEDCVAEYAKRQRRFGK